VTVINMAAKFQSQFDVNPSICEDSSVIGSLIHLLTRPDFSSSVEVRQHDVNR